MLSSKGIPKLCRNSGCFFLYFTRRVQQSLFIRTGIPVPCVGTHCLPFTFYGIVAKVGIMDTTTEMQKEGAWIKTRSCSIMITDVEDMTVETMYKIKAVHWT